MKLPFEKFSVHFILFLRKGRAVILHSVIKLSRDEDAMLFAVDNAKAVTDEETRVGRYQGTRVPRSGTWGHEDLVTDQPGRLSH